MTELLTPEQIARIQERTAASVADGDSSLAHFDRVFLLGDREAIAGRLKRYAEFCDDRKESWFEQTKEARAEGDHAVARSRSGRANVYRLVSGHIRQILNDMGVRDGQDS